MDTDRILEDQGGILVEVDRARPFRVGEDGLLHFRVRNLTQKSGRLTMRLRVPRAELYRSEAVIELTPGGIQDIHFEVSSDVPGYKLVEDLEIRFDLGAGPRRLVVPDQSLTFRMAPQGEGQDGKLDLSNASFEFRDHVGDVAIERLIARQDARLTHTGSEDWKALRLVSRPVEGHALVLPPREVGLRDLVLEAPGSGGEPDLRAFLFARKEVLFGTLPQVGEESVSLVLRRLPCRPGIDRENLVLSRYISGVHGRIKLRESGISIRDESSNGSRLNGRPLLKNVWAPLTRNFTLELTDLKPVLTLEGRLYYPRAVKRPLALSWSCSAEPGSGLDVGAEHKLTVNALRLRRLENAEHHQYFQVFRSLDVGAHSRSALQLKGRGIADRHATIVLYRGEWFVRRLSREGVIEVNDYPVHPEEFVSIAPGKTLTLGDIDFQVRATCIDDMTEL